ncbi:UNVERIFIED_CONTAM: hypothetical protein HDU68_011027 [Siphonaria sp. JEL0065]|nr:hypothetical protein HDU68_011027 [Siphonaria sp. JEL0065]
MEADNSYLQGKLKGRYIMELFELRYKVDLSFGGRKEAWRKFLMHQRSNTFREALDCPDLDSDYLSSIAQTMYRLLSSELHQPTVKTVTGAYSLPVPNTFSDIDQKMLKAQALCIGWGKITLYSEAIVAPVAKVLRTNWRLTERPERWGL